MHEDLVAMQSELSNPTKDTQGYGYKYAGLPGVLEVTRPILNAHRFYLTQGVILSDSSLSLICATRLIHVSGEEVRMDTPFQLGDIPMGRSGKPSMNAPQWRGAVETYMRRYGLLAILGLAGEDEDTDAAEKYQPPAPIVRIDETQQMQLLAKAELAGVELMKILVAAKVNNVADIPFDKYATIMHRLDATIKSKIEQGEDNAPDE